MTVGSIGDLRRAAHEAFGVEFAVDVVRILAVIGIHLAADGTLQPMVIAFMAPHGVVLILVVGAIDGGLYLCAAGFTDAVGRNMPLLIAGDAAMDTRQPVIDVVMLPAGRIVRIVNAVAFNALEHHAGLTAHAARSPILGVAHVGVVRMIVFRLAVGALTPASVFVPVPGVIIPVMVSITFNASRAAFTASTGGAVQPVLPVVALLTTIFTDVPVVGVVMLPGILPIIHSMGCCMNCDVRSAAIRANAGSVRAHGMMAALVGYCVTVLARQPVHLGVGAPVLPVPIVVDLAFNAGRATFAASAGGAVQPVAAIVLRLGAAAANNPMLRIVECPVVPVPIMVTIAFNAGRTAIIAGAGSTVNPVCANINLSTAAFADMPVVGGIIRPGFPGVRMSNEFDDDILCTAIAADVLGHGAVLEMRALVEDFTARASQGMMGVGVGPGACIPVMVLAGSQAGLIAGRAHALAVRSMLAIVQRLGAASACSPMLGFIGCPVVPVPIVFTIAFDAGGAAGEASAGGAGNTVRAEVNLPLTVFAFTPVVGAVMLPNFPVGDRVLHEIDNDVGCTAIAAGVIGHGAALEMRAVVEDLTTLAGKRMVGFVECPGTGAPVVTNFAFNVSRAALTASAGLAVQPVSPDIELFTAFIADTPVIGAIMRHVIPVVDSVFYFFSGVAGRAADTAQAIHTADVVIAVIDLLTTFIADMPVIDAVRFPGVLPVVHKMRHSTTDRDARLAAHFTGGFVSSAAVGGMVRLIDRFRAVNTFGPVAFLIVEESVKVIRMTFIDGHARLATLSADSFVSSITLGIMLSVVYLFIAVFALIPMMGTIVALGIHIPVMGSIACNARSLTGDTDTRRAAIDIVQFVIVFLPAGAAFIPVLRIIGAKRPIGMIDLGFRHIGGAAHKAFRRILTGDDVHIVCIIEVLHTAVLAHRVVNISTLHSIAVAPGGIVVLCTLRARLFRQCHA